MVVLHRERNLLSTIALSVAASCQDHQPCGCRDDKEVEHEEEGEEGEEEGKEGRIEKLGDYDGAGEQRREEVGGVGTDAMWASDIEADWDEDELRRWAVPIRGRGGLKRRLGDTRQAFADRLIQTQRGGATERTTTPLSAPSRGKRQQRQQQEKGPTLESASATEIIEKLTKELRGELARSSHIHEIIEIKYSSCCLREKVLTSSKNIAILWCRMPTVHLLTIVPHRVHSVHRYGLLPQI